MDYIELSVSTSDPAQAEILTAELAEYPFDSFSQEGNILKAYIPMEQLAGCKQAVDSMLRQMGVGTHTYIQIETVNWNAVWESNFEPVAIDGVCMIRAPFHPADANYPLDIVIMPKMSFGTGHHATTYLMSEQIGMRDFSGKRGLDMGSGTGVLAIIAIKRGAAAVDAVDIDQWAFENCVENIKVNGTQDSIVPILGNVSAIEGRRYDFVLANINRNILLVDMPRYVESMNQGAELLMSGILESDIEAIESKVCSLGLTVASRHLREGWVVVCCVKE